MGVWLEARMSQGWLLLLTVLQGANGQQAFRTQPRNLTVRVGATAVLRCEVLRASGAVQWVRDGLLLGPEPSLPGHPRYSMIGRKTGQYHLQILNVTLDDDAPYECQVGRSESSGAIVSHTVWLNVQIPPSQPYLELESDEPWLAGQEYTITCTAPDAKPPAQITLFKDGVELTEAESVTMSGSLEKLENTQAEVKVRAQSWDDGQRLLCRAKNPALSKALETSLVMKVYYPPQAPRIEGIDVEEVKAGSFLRALCVSHGGNPLATLHWTKNGALLSANWEVDIVSQKASSLLVMEVQPEDNQAELQCESVNQVSTTALFASRRLTVLFEPAKVVLLGRFDVVEGKTLSICCHTASSNPPVVIRWWLGSKELGNATVSVSEGENGGMMTMSNLTYQVSREENGLPVTCEPFNRGTRLSSVRSQNLRVFYPPQKVWLDVPPAGEELRSGAVVRLVCLSRGGNPTGSLTWLKNGRAVQTAARQVTSERGVSRELVLTLKPNDNMATYRCDATNEAKKVLSAQTKLHVQFPAISVKIAADKTELRRGETLQLKCVSGSSNPVATLSWSLGLQRLEGVGQAQNKAEFGGMSVSSDLALVLGSHHHGKRITCQAFSALLSEGVNTFYTLSVLFPPEFAPDQPNEIVITENDDVTLPIMVSANPDDITCEWTFKGLKVVKERDHRYCFPESWSLEIRNVTRQDAGQYTVECSSTEGKNHTTIRLNVLYAPSVQMTTDPVFVDVGSTADLICVADANPIIPGMFSWKWLGEGEVEELGEETEDENTGLLTIYDVTRAHAGLYQCTANNGIAPPGSVEGQLIVHFKPELQKGAQWRKVASRGDGASDADVTCQAQGMPTVLFTWAKNGVSLDLNNPRYLESTAREGAIHSSTVTVVNVSAELDYAIFTCTARNSLGEDTLDIQLLSTNHPDAPSELKMVSMTPRSVTLEWMPGFDGGLTQKFRVRYRWAGSDSYMYVDVFPPIATVYTVTGLAPATTYNFSVNALNTMGESPYADNDAVVSVTTADLDPLEDEPSAEDKTTEEKPGLPLFLVAILAVGGVLLLLNPLALFLYLRRRKGRDLREITESVGSVSEGKKGERDGSSGSSSRRYASSDRINAAAVRTLLVDSASSETGSSLYESYGGESSHYYYPTEDYRPSLHPHTEHPEDILRGMDPLSHEYEEVRDFGPYHDLQRSSALPASRFQMFPDSHSTSVEARRQGRTTSDPVAGVYDAMAFRRRRDSTLPFELRGELV